jgi:hypothetical protein
MILEEIERTAWRDLEAADNPKSRFRILTLCSVDHARRPQARTIVLRRTETACRLLEVHTDIRSQKWAEITANPNVTILGYCSEKQLQLRLQGAASLHPPGSEMANLAWNGLRPTTRRTYAGGPPGDLLAFDQSSIDAIDEDRGRQFFGVIIFRATALDLFKLQHANNRRALFDYDQTGLLISAHWVNP